jgi:hypothetical protein
MVAIVSAVQARSEVRTVIEPRHGEEPKRTKNGLRSAVAEEEDSARKGWMRPYSHRAEIEVYRMLPVRYKNVSTTEDRWNVSFEEHE